MNSDEEAIRDVSCEESIRLVLEYLDNELEHHDQKALEQHIHKCRSCYTRVEFERRLKNMVKAAPEDKAPEGLVHKIRKLSENF